MSGFNFEDFRLSLLEEGKDVSGLSFSPAFILDELKGYRQTATFLGQNLKGSLGSLLTPGIIEAQHRHFQEIGLSFSEEYYKKLVDEAHRNGQLGGGEMGSELDLLAVVVSSIFQISGCGILSSHLEKMGVTPGMLQNKTKLRLTSEAHRHIVPAASKAPGKKPSDALRAGGTANDDAAPRKPLKKKTSKKAAQNPRPKKISADEMEAALASALLGNHDAVLAIKRQILAKEAGLSAAKRPLALLLVSANQDTLCAAIDAIATITRRPTHSYDMRNYSLEHYVADFVGQPHGYHGDNHPNTLAKVVSRMPKGILVFDHVHAAHPNAGRVIVSLLEDETIKDLGKESVIAPTGDLMVVMTTDCGIEDAMHPDNDTPEKKVRAIRNAIDETFNGKLSDICRLVPIFPSNGEYNDLELEKEIAKANKALESRKTSIELTGAAKARILKLVKIGGDGNSNLSSVFAQEIMEPLAEKLAQYGKKLPKKIVIKSPEEMEMSVDRMIDLKRAPHPDFLPDGALQKLIAANRERGGK